MPKEWIDRQIKLYVDEEEVYSFSHFSHINVLSHLILGRILGLTASTLT